MTVFRAAFAAANAVLTDEALSVDDQAAVDEAVQTLRAAYDGLEKTQSGEPEDPGTGSKNGSAGTSDVKATKTGDSTPVAAAGMALVLSAGAAVLVMKKRSRR